MAQQVPYDTLSPFHAALVFNDLVFPGSGNRGGCRPGSFNDYNRGSKLSQCGTKKGQHRPSDILASAALGYISGKNALVETPREISRHTTASLMILPTFGPDWRGVSDYISYCELSATRLKISEKFFNLAWVWY